METEGYFKTLIESINDLVQVIKSDGSVLYSSPQLESLGGYTNEDAGLQEPFQWIHPDDRLRVSTQFEAQKKAGFAHYQTAYRIITKSGAVKHVETKITNALQNPLVNGIIAVVRDVTQRVESEEKIRKQSRLYQIMTDISKRFLNEDVESATKYMLTHLGQFAVVDRAYVYIVDRIRQHWDCVYEWRRPESEQFQSIFYQAGFPTDQGRWMQEQLAQGKIVNIGDIQDMPPEASESKAMFESDMTLSILLLPMLTNGQLIGFIGYDSILEPKIWQEDDITALTICTEILTSALLRSEAEGAIKQSLSVNAAVIESTAEGILVTDLNDNIIVYNTTFRDMWQIPDAALPLKKASVALKYALESVENTVEVSEKAALAATDVSQPVTITAYMLNKKVIECISKPQIMEGKVVGRVWSNRDITSRISAEREEREKGVAQAQFESLKNQINPHFLFNSLNVLASLVQVDADLSEKFIDQLARSYRYLLEQKDKDLVPLKTEIDFVHSFTFLLKIRFEEKLKVNIRLDPETLGYYIAPLTLQLLIENAVKHNVISAETPLVIDIYNEGDDFLVVSNNLQLRDILLPSTGVGQNNIKSRYKLFTKTEVVFTVDNDEYVVRIPFIKSI
ncbi:MAG TPA: histidine kinase [Smithellaceae bacterium]|nr:histidine kinase [Smithellaceae bacterium]